MKSSTARWTALVCGLAVMAMAGGSSADLRVGDQATLYESVDENLEHVSMEDMIDGKPLVLIVSSCT